MNPELVAAFVVLGLVLSGCAYAVKLVADVRRNLRMVDPGRLTENELLEYELLCAKYGITFRDGHDGHGGRSLGCGVERTFRDDSAQ